MGVYWAEVDTTTSLVTPERSLEPGGPTSCIVHVSDTSVGARTRVLEVDELRIGRGDDCGFVIACSHISGIHAYLRRAGES